MKNSTNAEFFNNAMLNASSDATQNNWRADQGRYPKIEVGDARYCLIWTSLMVGFPTENDELKQFVKEFALDNVGAFTSSRLYDGWISPFC